MSKFITFPSIFRKDGTIIQLSEVLSAVPENDWVWSILEFNGIGEAPENLFMA